MVKAKEKTSYERSEIRLAPGKCPCFTKVHASHNNRYAVIMNQPQKSRRGPQNNITQKQTSIFPDNNGAMLVRPKQAFRMI